MKTVVLGPPPAELVALITRRHSLGVDLFDEVWEGSYHVDIAEQFDIDITDVRWALSFEWCISGSDRRASSPNQEPS